MILPVRKERIKVLIVDDSAVIRAVIRRTLEQNDKIDIVGTAGNGEDAIGMVTAFQPDVIILDIEMPVMDGIAALPLILKQKPDAIVLICSTLSSRGADISLRAMAIGATDCILKPGGDSITTAQEFQAQLLRTVTQLAEGKQKATGLPTSAIRKPVASILPPQILAIGSSTGGPKALEDILKNLKDLPVPIVITQHMPKFFTALLAQNLQQNTGVTCQEGTEGTIIKPGCAYIAPGGAHMGFVKIGQDVHIHISDGPQENFCKPSVNPMLRSLAQIYGGRIQVAILTGMGADGLEGCSEVAAQGGRIIAQDEATSVVWGMPGAVYKAALCEAVLPLAEIAPYIRQSIIGTRAA